MFFNKYGGLNIVITNWFLNFSILVPTRANINFYDGNTGHAQVIGIILCKFPNCSNIYTLGPVYYCTDHPSNTISLDALKFHFGFKRFDLNHLNTVNLWTLKASLGGQNMRQKIIFTICRFRLLNSNQLLKKR